MSIKTAERMGPPEPGEAAPYYFRYIDRVPGGDILGVLETQREQMRAFLTGISEELSLRRYSPERWSIRQAWSHVNDTELVFLSRAFWFARGLDSPLPSYDQDIAAATARADEVPWFGSRRGVRRNAAGDSGVLSKPAGGGLDAKRHRQWKPLYRAGPGLHHRGARRAPPRRPRGTLPAVLEALKVRDAPQSVP